MCLPACLSMGHVCAMCTRSPEEGAGSPETGVTNTCELCSDTGNWTQVLWESSQCSQLLRQFSSSIYFFLNPPWSTGMFQGWGSQEDLGGSRRPSHGRAQHGRSCPVSQWAGSENGWTWQSLPVPDVFPRTPVAHWLQGVSAWAGLRLLTQLPAANSFWWHQAIHGRNWRPEQSNSSYKTTGYPPSSGPMWQTHRHTYA